MKAVEFSELCIRRDFLPVFGRCMGAGAALLICYQRDDACDGGRRVSREVRAERSVQSYPEIDGATHETDVSRHRRFCCG